MPFDPSKFRARLASEQKWYSIKNLTGGEADVMLYGEIGWLGTTADEFVREVKSLSASQINLHMSSPGGSVFDGIAIMNALRAHPANVTVYVDSLAASIASVIAMAGDRIVARQASEFMIHEAAGLVVGNADECREMADLLDRQSDKIAGIYAARAGGTVEDWRAAMKRESWYSAEEAVAAGLADEVDDPTRKAESAPDEMAVAASWDLSVFRYAGRDKAPDPQPAARAKPGPTAAPAADGVLTTNIASLVGEQIANALRASVTPEPATPAVTDTAVAPHNTAVEDGTWDKGANVGRLPSPLPVATAKKVYAAYDETRIEDGELPKDACNLPHHFVDADGTPGAASVAAVRNALARLPQTEGLTDTERDEAERHLQAHLDAYNDGADNQTATAREAQRIVVQLDADTLAEAIRKASQPAPAPAATGLAARAAHLKPARPAAPTWRDRVAHLNPPSSATTRPAP
jgi:ATP-dependent protease ClpP protease subunit